MLIFVTVLADSVCAGYSDVDRVAVPVQLT